MYRFQGTGNRSNGIYCEPDTTAHHHHFSPPSHHSTKKNSNKLRSHHQHRPGRSTTSRQQQQQMAHHRGDPDSEMDSSSEISDGVYPDSDGHGMTMQTRMNITQNGGIDSPPEPAPADLPMRMNGGLRPMKSAYADLDGDSEHSSGYHIQPGSGLYLPQEYLMSSPYQPKSPLPIGTSLATAKKLFQSDNLQNETGDSNSTLSTLPSQARLVGGLGGPSAAGNPMMTGIPSAPVILPVFPSSTPHPGQVTGNGLQSSRSLPRNQYSPSRFTLQKDCRVSDRCSWKCVCVALILLCVSLISILIYFAAIMGNCSRYPGTGCIVVEDAKVMARGEKHLPVITDRTSISPKSNDVDMVSPTSLVPEVTSSKAYSEFNDGLAPMEVIWGQVLTRRIEPYAYWTLEMNMRESGYVSLNCTFPWSTNWALLFRRNALPSVTQHDLMKIVKNGRLEVHRSKRRRHVRHADPAYPVILTNNLTTASEPDFPHLLRRPRDSSDRSVILLSEYLESGRWFLRLLNDDVLQRSVVLTSSVDTNAEVRCPQQCSGNGNCVYGKCHCFDGFMSADCSISVCPVLCSNHGRYGGGLCHCAEGWKGVECDIPETECEIGNCHGHGDCVGGKCVCREGWTGSTCEQRDCVDPSCSQHGICVQGKCLCHQGWAGQTCNFPDSFLAKCLPDCSGRGEFDAQSGRCICQKPYGGPNCLQVVCEKDCGATGICSESGACGCLAGWSGDNCEMLTCDPRCAEHGQCKNGTCICSVGWNGKHCTLAGCPNSCTHSDHGSCIMQDGYGCKCRNGWAGLDCSIRLETNCSDDVDNDEDGMTDCSDSECCESPACKGHLMCMTANDPVEVLLRKQPPSVTSSFYQRVKFLIEEESVQSYAQKDEYWERRVSVIRGQVLSSDGLGVVGIRVSVDKSQRLGFTLTRKGGWFDMLVNGGGSVTLQFQRAPFRPLTRTVFVPWNEIVVLDPPVVMAVGGNHLRDLNQEESQEAQAPCIEHDLELLKPIVMSSWFPAMVGASPKQSLVFGETQILQESIVIPGSDVHLLYHSSSSSGYLATILMQLTGPTVPPGLVLVHLKIIIEGELYKRTFEADPNITYTFGWKKRNVYQQKVYGFALARVAIGYEYSACSSPIWTTETVTLKGFDVDIADVGGWNLDIHHHYNFHEGILQKGDGSEVHLKEMPRLVKNVMGRKEEQRSLLCEPCENLLLSPVALATGPDGSLYVGDFNLVRRITPDNKTYTIVQLSATKVSHQYFMTISPADGHLYISDPEKYQVLRVNKMEEPIADPRANWSPVIGTGQKCVPGDPESCGDGFPAKLARLNHPKGLALTSGGSIYIADGPNLRFVNSHGIIHTLVGQQNPWTMRLSRVKTTDFEACRVVRAEASKVQLHWPTHLALNLVENKLLFIDEGSLFQITKDNQVERVLKCEMSQKIVRPILDLAFSPKGQLYFVTEDSNLFTVKSEGRAVLVRTDNVPPYYDQVYGAESKRNNLDAGSISALSIGADGTIYVADQAHLELKQVSHFIPTPNMNGDYEVVFPATGEVYVFNRYGQHTLTKDLKSGKVLYSFLYTKNTSYGKLSKISDRAENKILFLRDYSSVVSTIENTQGKKCSLKINRLGRLVHFQEMENSEIRLEYTEDGLLLAKMTTTGLSSFYNYDGFGRMKRIIGETGVITNFEYSLLGASIQVKVTDSTESSGVTLYKVLRNEETDKVTIQKFMGDESVTEEKTIVTDIKNASYSIRTGAGSEMLGMAWGIFPLLKGSMPAEGNLMRAPSFQYLHDPESPDIAGNKQESKFGLLGDVNGPDRILDRQVWVNDSRVLTLEFDQSLSREIIYNKERESVFTIQYDSTGLPLYFIPVTNQDHRFSMNISYDRFNRMENWKWGDSRGHQVTYGRNGFAVQIKNLDGRLLKTIDYTEQGQPSKITLQSGRTFSFQYDLHGGLKSVETPKGTKHTFSFQNSVGFTKLFYQPPGYGSSKNSFVKHFTPDGLIQSVWLPADSGRIFYHYDFLQRPTHILYSEGKILFKYKGHLKTITSTENKFEPQTQILTNKMSKTVQEKQEFGSKSGFSSAMFSYEYDSNFRPILIKSRVGGHPLDFSLGYNRKTGTLDQIGSFRIARASSNESSIFDGVAIFSRLMNGYGQPLSYSVTIQAMEVCRLEYSYESNSHRIQQLRMSTKTIGFSDQTYAPLRNFSYDADGQLISVDSVEPWKFEYDGNGNLKTLTYRGNTIPLEHNAQDRIVRFGDGNYRYDSVGRVIQNSREEFYTYNVLGQLKRAWKRGRFDVEYFYDYIGRLIARKDNHGNITQFFYSDTTQPELLTHIYTPKENRLVHLVYDDAQRLIFFQVNRAENFYVATDHYGTPLLAFNQYGLVVRELSRSPYGHIIYDSDPTFYLPIDFGGGILDKVTLLVHMRGGRVYDPLIGQFLTPDWEHVLSRLDTPEKIHLYRLNGNDPINTPDSTPTFDHQSWLSHLGYDLKSLSPQLFPAEVGLKSSSYHRVISGLESRVLEKAFDSALLETIPKSVVTKTTLIPNPAALIAQIDPPLGKNLLLSRTPEGKGMISSCPFCTSNRIDRDVFTTILNGSEFLSFVSYSPTQDVFHFSKRELWKASDDLADLKRLGGQNVTVNDGSEEGGKNKGGEQTIELKIPMSGATLFLKYGTVGSREETRLNHHAKSIAQRKAWGNIKELIRSAFPTPEFTSSEKEEILKNGHLSSHHAEFTHDPHKVPGFADDPMNVRFVKKGKAQRNRSGSNNNLH